MAQILGHFAVLSGPSPNNQRAKTQTTAKLRIFTGSLILKTLVLDVTVFQNASTTVSGWIQGVSFFEGVDAGYLICLLTFGVAVIIYTTYGGFHAVVWTDVMQGIVMFVGVILMLGLAGGWFPHSF